MLNQRLKSKPAIISVCLIISLPAFNAHADHYSYYSLGRLVSASYENGNKINYDYDSAGNLLGHRLAKDAKNSFIEGFYQNILNRPADPSGQVYWRNQIQNHSASNIAFGFFNSQEFIELQLNNTDFISILYKTLLNRTADEAEYQNWKAQLDSGILREMIIYEFLRGQEFKDVVGRFDVTAFSESDDKAYLRKSFVQRFYRQVLNRQPDQNGFNYWATQLANPAGTRTGGDIARGFFGSQEFMRRKVTDSQFLEIAYWSFFDRKPDENGKQYWMNALATGGNRDAVINGFIDSQEFINLVKRFGIRAN